MSGIREALDTYPLARWLRRGPMDLRPSLAKHLEQNTEPPAAPNPEQPVRALVAQLDRLIGEWRTQAQQLDSTGPTFGPNAERVTVLIECANELDQLLNEGKPSA